MCKFLLNALFCCCLTNKSKCIKAFFLSRNHFTKNRMGSFSMSSRYAEIYSEVARIPIPTAAKILPSFQGDAMCVRTLWSSQDFVKSEKDSFVRDYVIEKDSLKVISTGVISDSCSVLHAFSKSGKRQAKVLEKKFPEEKMYLEVWDETRKVTTIDMTDRREHGKILSSEHFKCLEWSSDENYLLYLAEAKKPKSVSFFNDSAKRLKHESGESSKDETESPVKGEEYAYNDTWGEGCAAAQHSVLCVLNIKTKVVEVWPIEKMYNNLSVGEAKWGPEDKYILFVGWCELPYRLGVQACINRKSAIYSINLQSRDIERLTTDENACVRSIRFSPNFECFVYLENKAGGPHFKCSKLKKCEWSTRKISTIVDIVESPVGDDFPGIYAERMPLRCWTSDGKHVYFTSSWRSNSAIVCVDVQTGCVQKIIVEEKFGASSVCDVHNNFIIASMSAPNIEPCLVVGLIDQKNINYIQWKFLDSSAPFCHPDIKWSISKLVPDSPNVKYSDLDFEIIVINPAEMKKQCPLIVIPHGGPHSSYAAGFGFLRFVKLGFAVCLVNYRGSTGFGESSINSLPGNVGTQDVSDCQQAALYARDKCGLDIGDIFLLGGSHGGFLGAHLSGQYPDFYKAAVLLNPVIDISSMTSVSDIPDWCLVEAGFSDFDATLTVTPEQLKVMWEKSPIKHAEKVRIPTLLLLGKKDLRVPMSQGLKYYQLLKARNVPVKIYQYEDNHRLLLTPHDGDVFMQSALWFTKHSSVPQ